MQLLNPGLFEEQAKNYFHRNFKNRHKGRIKPKADISQKTTSRWSQCTVSQQFRWRTTIDKTIAFLREHNIGICRATDKSCGDLIEKFMNGIDETCLMADAERYMRIVG